MGNTFFLLLILLFSVLIISAIFKKPKYGLYALIIISPLNELQRIPGLPFLNAAKIIGLLLIISWLMYVFIIKKGRYNFIWTGLEIPFAVFLFVLLLKISSAVDIESAISTYISLFSFAVILVVVVNIARNKKLINNQISLLVFMAALVSLLAIVQFMTKSTIFDWAFGGGLRRGGATVQRAVGAAENPNLGAFLHVLVFPFGVCLLLSEKKRIKKIIIGVSTFLILTGCIVTMSRSAYLAIAIQIIIMAVFLWKKIFRFRYIFAFLLFVFIFSSVFPEEILIKERVDSIINLEAGRRFEIFRGFFDMFIDYPLLGVGLGNFRYYISDYIGFQIAPHNNLISVAGQAGFFGLLAFLWLSVAPILILLRQIKLDDFGNDRILLIGFFASIIGYQINGLFHTSYVWNLYWIVLGLAMATVSIMCRQSISKIEHSTMREGSYHDTKSGLRETR